MQYTVSVSVSWSNAHRLITHIAANDKTEAAHTVDTYNSRHPEWDMRLLPAAPVNDNRNFAVYVEGK
jgi:hypothetical protein